MGQSNIQKEMESKLKMLNDLEKLHLDIMSKINSQEDKLNEKLQFRAERARVINELEKNRDNLTQKQLKTLKDIKKTHDEEYVQLKKESNELKEQNKQLQKQIETRQKILKGVREIAKITVDTWKYLMSQDKVIKSTILNLGMSGQKADLMRQSFEQSVQVVSLLGGNIEDIGKIQQGFADETGKARAMSAQMVKDVVAMGKGTGMGVENATKLAAQFEFMGVDVRNTMTWAQGVIDTAERMGVNTTKVFKSVTDNFRKLSTFTFKNGVQAYADMAMSAEKTRVSMESALNVAEATRGLDKVIELGANLQVMGGNFAKMDPFHWLYMVRNEPEKLNDEISKMTTGMFTLKKNSKGVFERFISPADADRLRNVAKSLGISKEEMFEIAQKRLDLNNLDRALAGKGMSAEQKEWIQGAAILNEKTGRYQVMVGSTMKDISSLTETQAKAFVEEQKLLEDRAKEAQTFDEAFKNTINAIKAGLLPILRGINWVLDGVRPLFDWLGESKSLAGAIATFASVMTLWKGGSMLFSAAVSKWGMLSRKGTGVSGIGNNLTGSQAIGAGKGKMYASKGAGMSALGKGAGLGLAAVGIGGGLALASVGISQMAKSMKELDATQIAELPNVIWALTGAIAAFTIPLAIIGTVGTVSVGGLLAFGGAALMIGGAVGIAATGIGYMAEGLGTLVESSKGIGSDLYNVAGGIAAIMGAMALGTIGGLGGLLGGFATLNKTLSIFDEHKDGLNAAGMAFGGLSTLLTGSKEDFTAVEKAVNAISTANVGKGGLLAELANLIKQPLKVEWADNGKVQLINDITLQIDSEKFMNKVYKVDLSVNRQVSAKKGTGGN